MCSRIAVYHPATGGALNLLGHEVPPNYNAAPTESLPIIRTYRDTGEKELILARWGILPFWVTEPDETKPYYKARAESIKPGDKVFWDSKDRHCVIPAGAFYKWSQADKSPYLIQTEPPDILYIAGLWRRWKNRDYAVVSFSVITTISHQSISDISRSSPVMLRQDQQDEWLSCDYESGRHLLEVYQGKLSKYRVNPELLNNPGNKGADCIQRLSC